MKQVLDDLFLARKYADEMHLGGDEGLLATAIRLIQHVSHFDMDNIRKHYEVVASNAQKGEGEALDPTPPIPTRPDVNTPIQGTLSLPPLPGEPLDILRNPLRTSSHAPGYSDDMPDPARRHAAAAATGDYPEDADREKENDIDRPEGSDDWAKNLAADREQSAQEGKERADREQADRVKADQDKRGGQQQAAQNQKSVNQQWNPDKASASLERDKTRALDKDTRWNEGA